MGRKKLKVELDVYLNQKQVGRLTKESTGAHYFEYTESWLDDDQALAISHSLPLREDSFKGQEVYNYFENLLPDNTDIRKKIAAEFSADSIEPVDLLSKIGRDCVGALQFVSVGSPAPTGQKIESKKVSDEDIARVIKNLAKAPLGMGGEDDEFRISIAGAHEKTAFLRINNEWHIPRGSTPTSHIFKPPIGGEARGVDLSTSVENEWLCNKICQRLGLQVPTSQIATFEDQKVLVVERFDRHWSLDSKQLFRIPVEDFCQALGFPSSQKYEKDGGPGILEIMSFLNDSNERIHDRHQFMRAQIIFFLLNATDGHEKISVFDFRMKDLLFVRFMTSFLCLPLWLKGKLK